MAEQDTMAVQMELGLEDLGVEEEAPIPAEVEADIPVVIRDIIWLQAITHREEVQDHTMRAPTKTISPAPIQDMEV